MKEINLQEQKKILTEMLSFFDEFCREHDVKYSLMAGSLIGAVRHKGFIPWDDDVDVVLTKKNFLKLKKNLDKETGRYQILKDGRGGERFSFLKLIDTRTQALENRQWKFNEDYGVYLDIFCYYPTSDGVDERKKQYRKIKLLESLVSRRKLDLKNDSLKQNILCAGKNIVSVCMGYGRIKKIFNKTMNLYDDGSYIVSNWPAYGFEHEIQLAKNTEEYIDAEFEGLKVMIFKNYDEILRTTFGDYMQLPPESERVPKHGMKAWWREGYEDEAEKLKRELKKDEMDGKK